MEAAQKAKVWQVWPGQHGEPDIPTVLYYRDQNVEDMSKTELIAALKEAYADNRRLMDINRAHLMNILGRGFGD